MKFKLVIISSVLLHCTPGILNAQQSAQQVISYCEAQAVKTLSNVPAGPFDLPRSITSGAKEWHYVNNRDWCSGFWPGILWNLYRATNEEKFKTAALGYTAQLKAVVYSPGFDHDLGFMIFNSFGNGYKLTRDSSYKRILLAAADSLAKLYNPKVGTILSWPTMVKKMNWPHNTIIDNMINLELLFWASKNGGPHSLYEIAERHAETTMKNHFRPDFTTYHVVVYDTVSGKKIKGVTHQGYADNSVWARGQSWAIYGFTMCYRETANRKFLLTAEKAADAYLKRLPADLIPYWDFNDPGIPNVSRDASAAAVTASALLELSGYVKNGDKASTYRRKAVRMLRELSSPAYESGKINNAFLMHSTGHHPAGSEIDASIIYADYYYLEALLRWKELENRKIIN